MQTKAALIYFFLLPSLSASPSLFFTQAEIDLIYSAHKKRDNHVCITLSALIYVTRNQWSFWLNNKLIRPHQTLPVKGLQLVHVTPQKVTFSWRPQASSKILTFKLRPNERILLKEKEIESTTMRAPHWVESMQ